MTQVGSRELKNRLGKYLAMVRSGVPIQVTDRGEPVACIIPVRAADESSRAEHLARLVAEGAVRPASGRLGRHRPVVLRKGKSIVRMLAEERR